MQTPGRVTFILTGDEANGWMGRPAYSKRQQEDRRGRGDQPRSGQQGQDVYVDTGTYLGIGATRYQVALRQIQEVKPDGLVLTLKESEVKTVPPAGEQPKP